MKHIITLLLLISSLLLIPIGLDKFFNFLEPPCSLMNTISPLVWKGLGVIQILGGVLIWLPKYRKAIASFFIVFMLTFTIYHLSQSTYDIGGSVFMIILLSLLLGLESYLKK